MTGMPRSLADRMVKPEHAWLHIQNTTHGDSRKLEPLREPTGWTAFYAFWAGVWAVIGLATFLVWEYRDWIF